MNEKDDRSQQESLRRSKLLTSLSMNDIDIIGTDDDDGYCAVDGLVPVSSTVRSDSLYSLHLDVGTDPTTKDVPAPPKGPSLIRSSIELSKSNFNDGRRKRLPHRQVSENKQNVEQEKQQQGMLHFRKKSINRSKAAVLQRFQQKSQDKRNSLHGGSHSPPLPTHTQRPGRVVSMAALKAALSQSHGIMDNGDLFARQQKTVFVSEYL